MGFCYLSNIALAAARLGAQGRGRVAIVDIDVHHGNGTNDIFHESDQVLFISLHQYPHYPGTGGLGTVGEGPGRGSRSISPCRRVRGMPLIVMRSTASSSP